MQANDGREALAIGLWQESIKSDGAPTGIECLLRLGDREHDGDYRPTGTASASLRSDSSYGALAMPRSGIIAATYFAGVTSNAGFSTPTPFGTICLPAMCVTSFSLRCSMGMPLPSAVSR